VEIFIQFCAQYHETTDRYRSLLKEYTEEEFQISTAESQSQAIPFGLKSEQNGSTEELTETYHEDTEREPSEIECSLDEDVQNEKSTFIVRVETNFKFKCQYCSLKFTQRSNLMKYGNVV
jgi:hypothetical protein